jgi:hypothetical protein
VLLAMRTRGNLDGEFWYVTPADWKEVYRGFGRTYPVVFIPNYNSDPEEGDKKFVQDFGTFLPKYTMSHPKDCNLNVCSR